MAGEPRFEGKIGAQCGGSFTAPTLPPPRPKSPPEYPDLYGKRRELAKLQMLEREIGFLEEELKSVEQLQPASRFCKEVADFVVANSDPFTPVNRKNRRQCWFWKWLCGMPCFNLSRICCCCCCSGRSDSQKPTCCGHCEPSKWCSCVGCPKPNCQCCSCSCSCPELDCCNCCKCRVPKLSCNCCRVPSCSCCKWLSCCPNWKCSVPKCTKVCCCSNCTKTCCNPCC